MVLSYFFDDTEVSFSTDLQLLEYIKEKKDKEVESILQNAKDLHKAVDTSRSSLLHYAAEFGNENIASYLIKQGAKINLQNKLGNTSLILATKGRHAATIKLLLESDADMYICNNEGNDALQMALQQGAIDVEIAKLFLNQLTSDCSSDSAEIAKRLMKINCPLYVAVLLRDEAVSRYMLSGCCSINAKDPTSGKTALHVAVENLDSEQVELLLQLGADVNATDALNKTPLAMLNSFDDDEVVSILQCLLDAQPDITSCDDDGFMQMYWILKTGSQSAVENILEYEFDMSATDEHKRNILHYLAQNVDVEVVHLIYNMEITDEVSGNARDENGSTPLHYAMNFGNAEFVWYFGGILTKNIANNKGITPFLQAIESTAESKLETRVECVKSLVMYDLYPDVLLGQYFKIYHARSEIKRDLALLEPVIAMLVIQKANGKTINQDIFDGIEKHPQLKEYFDLCESEVNKMKDDRMFDKGTSMFDYVAGNTNISDLNTFSSEYHGCRINFNIRKYKSIPIYHLILDAQARDARARQKTKWWLLVTALFLFAIYNVISWWLYDDDTCLLCYRNAEIWPLILIICIYVSFSLYTVRKRLINFFKYFEY